MKNIPKKIHMLWFGGTEPNVPHLNKIKEIYNDYELRIWTEDDFDINNSNDFVKFAYSNKKWAFLSDYFRMKVLFEEGGIYLDTDMTPVEKFDIESDADLFLGYEYRNNITMGFIASVKGHKYVKSVMEYYESIINPGFLPLGNLVWTEILYSHYPKLGVSNKTKRHEDIQIMNSNSFGLWSPNKKKSYFIHGHTIDWINSRLIRNAIVFAAKFAKLTPAFVENIMVKHQRRMTNIKSTKLLDKAKPMNFLISGDVGMLSKDDFDKIVSSGQRTNIILEFKNKKLKKTISGIYNVNKVMFGKEKSKFKSSITPTKIFNHNSELSNELVIQICTRNGRTNIETRTNIYSRLFKGGVERILVK